MRFLLIGFLLTSSPASACMEIASFRKLFRGPDSVGEKPEPPQAVILYDRTKGFDTGECVAVEGRRADEGGREYLVTRKDGPRAWVSADEVYVFDGPPALRDPYDAFFSEGDLLRAAGAGSRQQAQLRELSSREFLERAMRSKRARVRGYAAQRVMALWAPEELAEAWLRFSEDEEDVRRSADYVLLKRLEGAEPPDNPRLHAAIEMNLSRRPCDAQLVSLTEKSGHPGKERLLAAAAQRGCRDAWEALRRLDTPRSREKLERLAGSADEYVRLSAILQRPRERPLSQDEVAVLVRYDRRVGLGDVRGVRQLLFDAWPDPAVQAWAKESLQDPRVEYKQMFIDAFMERLGTMPEPAWERAKAVELLVLSLKEPGGGEYIPHFGGWGCFRDYSKAKVGPALDQLLLETLANHGSDAAFAKALKCLDGVPKEFKAQDWDIVRGWLAPWGPERLAAVRDPGRRSELARRLDALRQPPASVPLRPTVRLSDLSAAAIAP